MQIQEIKEIFSGSFFKVKYNESMAKHTYMRVGGPALVYVEADTLRQAQDFLKAVKDKQIKYYIVGSGSNILVGDDGFDGAILRLKGGLAETEFIEEPVAVKVKTGAGSVLSLMVKKSVDYGCTGFEMLAGIPGTVGGALAGNSGTPSGAISDNLVKVQIINTKGMPVELNKNELNFSYRNSSLAGQVIVSAEFLLNKSSRDEAVKKVTEHLLKRSQTQPLGTFNAGSIFKNPAGYFAGKLIEDCGFKGYKMGGAAVSGKHANFIINNAKATASDVLQIINDIRAKVKEKFSVELELEIKII